MKTIKVKSWSDVPKSHTGIVEREDGYKEWYKNGSLHREDSPARIYKGGYKQWWLDGFYVWDSCQNLDLTNQIILSKEKHLLYPTVQVWKILDKDEVYEQIIISGMADFIKE